MKKYTVAIIPFLIGIILFLLFKIIGSKITADGFLIEPFWMIPTGYFFLVLGVIFFILIYFRKNKLF